MQSKTSAANTYISPFYEKTVSAHWDHEAFNQSSSSFMNDTPSERFMQFKLQFLQTIRRKGDNWLIDWLKSN